MIAIFNRAKALKSFLVAGFVAISLWAMTAPAYALDMYDNEIGQKQTTERYDKIQSEKGGMNNFDDVDPRRDTNAAKAKTLIDTARRRNVESPGALESAREAISDIKDNITGAADDAVNAVTKKADQLTDKAANAADRAGDKADRLTDKAARAADKAGDRADRAAKNLTNRPADAAGRGGNIKPGRGDYQLND